MKTITYTFGGECEDGDLIMVNCRAARGGQSTAKCVIGDPATPDIYIPNTNLRRGFRKALDLTHAVMVLAELINSITSEWAPGSGDFKAHAKGKTLTVMASNLMNDVTFHCDFEGSMKETCEIEVMG